MPVTWWSQLIWLCAVALASFLSTWIIADLLLAARAVYIGVHGVVTAVFLFGYLTWSQMDWAAFISHQWQWGLISAAVSGVVLIGALVWLARWQSLVRLPPPRARGIHLMRLLIVDGVIHGTAEALMISVLPVLIIWQTFSPFPWFHQWPGAAFVSALALVVSLFVISAHHLGYREFRGPLILSVTGGNALLTLVYILTMNPLSAVIGHIMLHMGAEFQRIDVPLHKQMSFAGNRAGQQTPAA